MGAAAVSVPRLAQCVQIVDLLGVAKQPAGRHH
jgi:hypothetical protein